MRVNIYAEELTTDVDLVATVAAGTGRTYHGVRFNLESSIKLHHAPDDDDRSAVTFWGPSHLLRELFTRALNELSDDPPGTLLVKEQP